MNCWPWNASTATLASLVPDDDLTTPLMPPPFGRARLAFTAWPRCTVNFVASFGMLKNVGGVFDPMQAGPRPYLKLEEELTGFTTQTRYLPSSRPYRW